MNNNTPKFHKWFHDFLVYFALIGFGVLAILSGAKNILDVYGNGYKGMEFILVAITNVFMIASGILMIKARFDLAAFKKGASNTIWIACGLLGAVFFVNHLLESKIGDDLIGANIGMGVIFIIWGFAISEYYSARSYLFRHSAE